MCHFYACFWFRKQRGNLCFWQVVEIRNCTSTVVSDTVLRHTRYSVDDLQLTLCFPVRRQPLKHHCPEFFCFFWSCRLHQVTLEFHEMKWKTVNAIFLHAVILFHPTQCLAMTFFFSFAKSVLSNLLMLLMHSHCGTTPTQKREERRTSKVYLYT